MAVVAVDGGDELRSVAACGKQRRGGGRSEESERASGGLRGVVGGDQGDEGGSQAGREELAQLACAPGTQLLWDEGRKTTKGCSGGLGRLLLGHQVGGPQVSAR